jgi:putative ABC transport system permease protein
MPVPLRYNLKSLLYRRTATLLTLFAVALTVAVLVILLAVSAGFRRAMQQTGRADNLLCLRASASSEGESTISRDEVNVLRGLPQIARSSDGRALAAAEMYAGISLEKETGGTTNVPLRGAAPESFDIRENVRIVKGRRFRPGSREIVVGKNLVGRIRNCREGGALVITHEKWDVVGEFDAGDSAFDTEIWGDIEVLLQVFDRTYYNSVILRAMPGTEVGSPPVYEGEGDSQRLVKPGSGLAGHIHERIGNFKLASERDYFIDQAGFLGGTLMATSIFLVTLMGFGALAGLTNTFLAAVAGRTREIGGLLAIGYRPWQIFLGFLAESLTLSLAGGAVGIAATLWIDGIRTGTTNWGTFTELAFAFTVDRSVISSAVVLTVAVGILGGVLPAWRASRLRAVVALRRG